MKTKIIFVVFFSLFIISCNEMLLGPEPENTPQQNFEILWKSFDQNYALFPVKNVDWNSLHNIYGSRISSSTTQSELWDITCEMLAELNDGHVMMFNKGITEWFSSSEIMQRQMDDFSLDLVFDEYVGEHKQAGYGYFNYGKVINENIGYIHITTFTGSNYGNGIDWADDIDKIVSELYDTDALIIDLRNNGGGYVMTMKKIASAFIDRDITYFYQQMKTGTGHNDFSEPIPLTVSLRSGVLTYTKKIALLTNRFSASGSEHFSQIFENLSYATQIGDTTLGCFGDIIGTGTLPNGWIYLYPCRLTKTPEGFCPEGLGIIPDILVENTKADINAGRDNVMVEAIDYLTQ